MCSLCRHNPCDRRCPNSTYEPEFICSMCETEVVGKYVYDKEMNMVCEECVLGMTVEEYLTYIAEDELEFDEV